MKSDNQTTAITSKENNMEVLLQETKEVLATNLNTDLLNGKVRSFSVADMWKIQKNQQSSRLLNKWLN
jgi:hypothetical protein